MERIRFLAVLFVASALLLAGPVAAQDETNFPRAQIDQLVAPIALYPDALVAQILMASTYPLQVVEAARWRQRNPDVAAASLDQALADRDWDPSVKSLVAFPSVLERMNENLDWTQDLGDAYLGQPDDVMDAIQRLRRDARRAGNLTSNDHQVVLVQDNDVIIEPVQPGLIYVPAYDPILVFGPAWSYSTYYYPTLYSYPPSYWYPSGYTASHILAFGLGIAVGGVIFGDLDWHRHHITVNRNINRWDRHRNYLPPNQRIGVWQHNPAFRGNVRYRQPQVRERYRRLQQQRTRPGGIRQPGPIRNVVPRTGPTERRTQRSRPGAAPPRTVPRGQGIRVPAPRPGVTERRTPQATPRVTPRTLPRSQGNRAPRPQPNLQRSREEQRSRSRERIQQNRQAPRAMPNRAPAVRPRGLQEGRSGQFMQRGGNRRQQAPAASRQRPGSRGHSANRNSRARDTDHGNR